MGSHLYQACFMCKIWLELLTLKKIKGVIFLPLPQEEKKYTYVDYLNWPEDERWEIIDGVPYMQAAPSPAHQLISSELNRQISNYLQGKPCKSYPAPFCVKLIQGDENEVKNVVEPDISIICDKSKIDDKGCNGTPDMIIEILSPSSGKMDKIIKFNKYEKAGVKEYWLVEPEQKIVSVFLLQDNHKFSRPDVYADDEKINVSIFTDLAIDLSSVFSFE